MERKRSFIRYSGDKGQSSLGEQLDVQNPVFLIKAATLGPCTCPGLEHIRRL